MANGVAVSQDFKQYFFPMVTESIGLAYKQLDPVLPKLAKVMKTDKAMDIVQELVGIGMSAELSEQGTLSYESHNTARSRVYEAIEFGKAMAITQRAIDDGKAIDHIKIMTECLAKADVHRKEYEGAKFLNNPTSTSDPYVGMDGKALLATDHVLANGGSFANMPSASAPLSESALEDACIAVWQWRDGASLRMNADVKSLVIPPALHFEAARLLKGIDRPGTADRDINVMKMDGRLQDIIKWNFLSSSTAYFLLTDIPGFKVFERKNAEIHSYNEEPTRSLIYQIISRYAINYDDAHFVYGSTGT